MSDDLSNPNLMSFLDDVVNEVNEDIQSDEREFDQFLDSLSDQASKYSNKELYQNQNELEEWHNQNELNIQQYMSTP